MSNISHIYRDLLYAENHHYNVLYMLRGQPMTESPNCGDSGHD